MSIKVHFLISHLDRFPDSDGQDERFQQYIKVMEERYQGRRNVNIMVDYC